MKSVAITGVSRGLGLAMAREFISRGYRIIGTARKAEDAARLEQEFQAPHRVLPVDSTDPGGLAKLASLATRDGPIDLVIANAGIINGREPAWEISDQAWQQNLDVNVMGMVHTIKAFVPGMLAANHGTFVGMSSGWGKSASTGLGPYCASKFAVEGLIGCLVLDLEGSAVTAVALDPGGGINTDMLADCLPDEHHEYRTADVWAKGAVTFIETHLVEGRNSGSQEVPESAHAAAAEVGAGT
jgi:NAD(P)-dependent dehydrogenase (short-subunit alcohol dehydrogenase family)